MKLIERLARKIRHLRQKWSTIFGCKAARLRSRVLVGKRARCIFVYPEHLGYQAALYKISHWCNCRISSLPTQHSDLGIFWDGSAERQPDETLVKFQQTHRVLNFDCRNVGKQHISQVFASVFGYSMLIEPASHRGKCVRKSNRNATHDGVVLDCPVENPDTQFVYQIVINNVVGNEVEDIRVPIFFDEIPFVYLKRRPIKTRFSNENSTACLAETDRQLDAAEVERILRFCRELQMDYGELDVLRDVDSKRLYIVDVNPTPFGPPNHLRSADYNLALRRMSVAFQNAFLIGPQDA